MGTVFETYEKLGLFAGVLPNLIEISFTSFKADILKLTVRLFLLPFDQRKVRDIRNCHTFIKLLIA